MHETTNRALSALVVTSALGTGELTIGLTHGCGASGSEGSLDAIVDAGTDEAHEASLDAKRDTHDGAADTSADVPVDHDAGRSPRRTHYMLRDWEAWTGYSCTRPLNVPGE